MCNKDKDLAPARAKRDTAYKLLLAYAECRRGPWEQFFVEEYEAVCKKHGWDGTQPKGAFVAELRTRALEAAKGAG